MGFLDKLKGKAKTAVDQHGDKIAGGIDKAAAMADKKTKDALDKLDGKNDGDLGGPAAGRPDHPGRP